MDRDENKTRGGFETRRSQRTCAKDCGGYLNIFCQTKILFYIFLEKNQDNYVEAQVHVQGRRSHGHMDEEHDGKHVEDGEKASRRSSP